MLYIASSPQEQLLIVFFGDFWNFIIPAGFFRNQHPSLHLKVRIWVLVSARSPRSESGAGVAPSSLCHVIL